MIEQTCKGIIGWLFYQSSSQVLEVDDNNSLSSTTWYAAVWQIVLVARDTFLPVKSSSEPATVHPFSGSHEVMIQDAGQVTQKISGCWMVTGAEWLFRKIPYEENLNVNELLNIINIPFVKMTQDSIPDKALRSWSYSGRPASSHGSCQRRGKNEFKRGCT